MVQAGKQTSLDARLAGTNINAKTFLATDYLNHFNEIIMLIDMIPDVPECLEDARLWQPKSYVDHFRDSGFTDRNLAIEAYHAAQERYRQPLEDISARLNDKISALLGGIETLLRENRLDESAGLVEFASHDIRHLIQLASAVINGTSEVTTVEEVDMLLSQTGSEDISQDEIDKLF
jgi:hypothetical protein